MAADFARSPIIQQRLSSSNGPEGGRPSITSNFFYSGSENRSPKPQPLHTMAAIFIKCPRPLMASTSLHTAIMAIVQLSIASKSAPSAINLLQTRYNAKPISGFHRHSSNITLQPSRSSSGSENRFAPYTTASNCNAMVGVRPLQAFPATPGSSHA
eukprot:Gb_01705 [translate_table: standard]